MIDSDFENMLQNIENEDLSSTEYRMKYFETRNYNFQLLLNDLLFSSEPTSETHKNDKEDPTVKSSLDFDDQDMDKKLKSDDNFGRISTNLKEKMPISNSSRKAFK